MGSGSSASVTVRPDCCSRRSKCAGMPQEVVGNRLDRTRLLADRTKGCGHRADASLQLRIVRQQRGQEIGETIAVGKPLGKSPVRLIHLLLHARPVEGSVQEIR